MGSQKKMCWKLIKYLINDFQLIHRMGHEARAKNPQEIITEIFSKKKSNIKTRREN